MSEQSTRIPTLGSTQVLNVVGGLPRGAPLATGAMFRDADNSSVASEDTMVTIGSWHSSSGSGGRRRGVRAGKNVQQRKLARATPAKPAEGGVEPPENPPPPPPPPLVVKLTDQDSPDSYNQLLNYAYGQVAGSKRTAATLHALTFRLMSRCREWGWVDEGRITACCIRAATEAVLVGSPGETRYGRLLGELDTQDRVDGLNQAASGCVPTAWSRRYGCWWDDWGRLVLVSALLAAALILGLGAVEIAPLEVVGAGMLVVVCLVGLSAWSGRGARGRARPGWSLPSAR